MEHTFEDSTLFNEDDRKTNDYDYDYDIPDDTDKVFAGGRQTNKTFIYDGNFWSSKTPMNFARDRPACSLINQDGKVICSIKIYGSSHN